MGTTSAKFDIIRSTLSQSENKLSVASLCRIAGVSRSGYYNWLKAEETRRSRDEQDRNDFDPILEAYHFRGYKKGARSIYILPHKRLNDTKQQFLPQMPCQGQFALAFGTAFFLTSIPSYVKLFVLDKGDT